MNTDIVTKECTPPSDRERKAMYDWKRAQLPIDDELTPCEGEAIRDITHDIFRRGCGVEGLKP